MFYNLIKNCHITTCRVLISIYYWLHYIIMLKSITLIAKIYLIYIKIKYLRQEQEDINYKKKYF